MSNQLLYMYNDNFWVQAPDLGPWEARVLDGLNELLELQKCDQSPGLCPSLKSGHEACTWEVPNAWCRCAPLTVQPISPAITLDSGLFMGTEQEGLPPPNNIVPGWLHPGPPKKKFKKINKKFLKKIKKKNWGKQPPRPDIPQTRHPPGPDPPDQTPQTRHPPDQTPSDQTPQIRHP